MTNVSRLSPAGGKRLNHKPDRDTHAVVCQTAAVDGFPVNHRNAGFPTPAFLPVIVGSGDSPHHPIQEKLFNAIDESMGKRKTAGESPTDLGRLVLRLPSA